MEKNHKGIVLVPSDFDGIDWIEKMAKSGLNTLGLHSGGGPGHDVLERLQFMKDGDFRHKMTQNGLDYEYEIHTSHVLIDHDLFAAKPEYFPAFYQNQERIPDGNWCVSNPEAMKLVVDNAVLLAKKLPATTHRYFFWGVDRAHRDWCHCPKCAHLNSADQTLITANAIAERIHEADSMGKVCFLAYHNTLTGPSQVKPNKNVFLEFAPIRRCYYHALNDDKCAINRSHKEAFEKLLKIFDPTQAHILEYYMDSSLYGRNTLLPPVKPTFYPELFEEDVRYYTSLGIRSMTSFAVRQDGEYMALHGDKEFQMYAEILNKFL